MKNVIIAIVFILLLTLAGDSPAPEQIVVSRYRQVRSVVVEERHEVTKDKCRRIIHLKEVDVEVTKWNQ